MIPTMVLAAGLGMRMRPLSQWCAKPLVPLGDRPLLAHILARLGGGRVIVNAHYRAADLRAFAARECILVSEEPDLLGTAGGVAHAARLLGDGDILVWNGDILAPIDVAALVDRHRAARSEATLVVKPRSAGEGNVGVDGEGHVVRLRRESVREAIEVRGGEFVGVHVVGAALRAMMKAPGGLIEDVYLPALHRGARVGVEWLDTPWWDIGTVSSYRAAAFAWLSARGTDSWIAPGARVSPAVRVERCIVGEGAVVEGGGVLRGCIVWPGATARGGSEDLIVAPQGEVRAPLTSG